MSWRIRIHDTFEVIGPTGATPMMPTVKAGVLLLMLVESGGRELARRELAALLYPESDEVRQLGGLRTTLVRLRQWLPELNLKIGPKSVILVDSVAFDHARDDALPSASEIVPGLNHPWIDHFRHRRAGPECVSEQFSPATHLREAVLGLAETDPDAAREILCHASSMVFCLPISEMVHLLARTRPRLTKAAYSAEHAELEALVHQWCGDLNAAARAALRAHRLAKSLGESGPLARASALVMFLLLESGDMEGASDWLGSLIAANRVQRLRLSLVNAQSAFYWNSNRHMEALSTMLSGMEWAKNADRQTQAHYFSNLSVLAAETHSYSECESAIQQADSVIVLPQDRIFYWNTRMAQAESWSQRGAHSDAIELLKQLVSESQRAQNRVATWYQTEAMAEAYHRAGTIDIATNLIKSVISERESRGLKMTLRLAARYRRICG